MRAGLDGKDRLDTWTLFDTYLGGCERVLQRGVTESKHCFKKVNLLSAISGELKLEESRDRPDQ